MPYEPYNPYNPYNAYQTNPYFQQRQPQPQPQTNTYAFVNGVEGAKAYAIQPNQSVMLMDSDQPIAYMKTANAMGQANIKYFKLVEVDETTARGKTMQNPEYATKADLEALSKRIDSLMPKESTNA